MVNHHINIPSDNYGQVEDIHLMLEHILVNSLQDLVKAEPLASKNAIRTPLQLQESLS